MNNNTYINDIVEEIGNQTLARLGLNIFSLNTYSAYEASVNSTSDLYRTYKIWGNNDNALRGQSFEDIDTGHRNIEASLLGTGHKTYTTDQLYDIKNTADILSSEKKLNNLNEKDREKLNYIIKRFPNEIKLINENKELLYYAKKQSLY